jgi:hypothetical protein
MMPLGKSQIGGCNPDNISWYCLQGERGRKRALHEQQREALPQLMKDDLATRDADIAEAT